jgi:hypothetical protein
VVGRALASVQAATMRGKATREGGTTPRKLVRSLRVCDEAHGKTSNTRPATVKVKEGAGKANDPLPRAREAYTQDSSERLGTWNHGLFRARSAEQPCA